MQNGERVKIRAYSKASCTVAEIVQKKLSQISLGKGDETKAYAIHNKLIPSLIACISSWSALNQECSLVQTCHELESQHQDSVLIDYESDLNRAACHALDPSQYLRHNKQNSGKTKFKNWLAYSSFECNDLSAWMDRYEGHPRALASSVNNGVSAYPTPVVAIEQENLSTAPKSHKGRKERTLQGMSLSALASGMSSSSKVPERLVKSSEQLDLLAAALGCSSYSLEDMSVSELTLQECPCNASQYDELIEHYFKRYTKSDDVNRSESELATFLIDELQNLSSKSAMLMACSKQLINATRNYAHCSKLRSVEKIFAIMPVDFDYLVASHKDNFARLEHDLMALTLLSQYPDLEHNSDVPALKWHQAVASCEHSVSQELEIILQDHMASLHTMELGYQSLSAHSH